LFFAAESEDNLIQKKDFTTAWILLTVGSVLLGTSVILSATRSSCFFGVAIAWRSVPRGCRNKNTLPSLWCLSCTYWQAVEVWRARLFLFALQEENRSF
jgi:hypothetical protein